MSDEKNLKFVVHVDRMIKVEDLPEHLLGVVPGNLTRQKELELIPVNSEVEGDIAIEEDRDLEEEKEVEMWKEVMEKGEMSEKKEEEKKYELERIVEEVVDEEGASQFRVRFAEPYNREEEDLWYDDEDLMQQAPELMADWLSNPRKEMGA